MLDTLGQSFLLCAMTTLDIEAMPPAGRKRREWLQARLAEHMNTETGEPWTQKDVATKVDCSQGLASRVLEGKRTTGAKTTEIQRVVAKVLDISVGELFGHICKDCPRCGAEHAPRRAIAAV